MSVNTQPVFTKTPNSIPTEISAANTASDGSGALVQLLSAGVEGSLVQKVVFRNAQIVPAVSSAMVCRIFVSDAGGLNFKLVGEVALPAATRSASAIGAVAEFVFSPAYTLKDGQKMSVAKSVHAGVQDLVSVCAYAGDF
jgi:hypothetical protein